MEQLNSKFFKVYFNIQFIPLNKQIKDGCLNPIATAFAAQSTSGWLSDEFKLNYTAFQFSAGTNPSQLETICEVVVCNSDFCDDSLINSTC